jgi:SAM-dependent methyltransferase
MQAISDRKKSERTSVLREDITKIHLSLDILGISVGSVICHGAREGQEVDWFSEEFGIDAVGTDLLERKHPKVAQWDFHDQFLEWVGQFDLVYSNSLDHAHDPELAVRTWFDQLTSGGVLCIQWSHWSLRAVMGDCFGAGFHDYVFLLDHIGEVIDVVHHRGTVVTIVARRKR